MTAARTHLPIVRHAASLALAAGASLLALLIASPLFAQPPDAGAGAPPAPAVSQLTAAELAAYRSGVGSRGDTVSGTVEPAPFWRQHRLVVLQNRTFPHIPRQLTALGPDGHVTLFGIEGDRMSSPSAVADFNRVALAEHVVVTPANIDAYMRFVLDAMICSFRPERLVLSEADARAILASPDAGAPGSPPARLPVTASAHAFTLHAFYWEYWWGGMRELTVGVNRDGTASVSLRTWAQRR